MTLMKDISIFKIVAVTAMLLVGGCASQRTVPQVGFGNFDVKTQLMRDDIVILQRVEGTSETESILLGTIQIIDGKNVKVLGFPFFKEQYTCVKEDPCLAKTEDRAYYKALEATPEADAVFYKSMNREHGGIPLLWETESVTFSGKAFTVKPDQPKASSEQEAVSQ